MRIPYAALRFFSEKKQTWGLNFLEIRRDRQNTPGILLIQRLDLSPNKQELLKESKT
jgi:hypothetical protein